MRKTEKEYKKRIAEELELYSNILNKTVSLFKIIDSFEKDLGKVIEQETILIQYEPIIQVNVKEITAKIRRQLEKSLDFLDIISKTGKYLR